MPSRWSMPQGRWFFVVYEPPSSVSMSGRVAAGDIPAETGKLLQRLEYRQGRCRDGAGRFKDRRSDRGPWSTGAIWAQGGGRRRQLSRMQKFAAAKEAFDEWASRVRQFLDSSTS